jgi:hypothetical protein
MVAEPGAAVLASEVSDWNSGGARRGSGSDALSALGRCAPLAC